jgi:hypothetical protein
MNSTIAVLGCHPEFALPEGLPIRCAVALLMAAFKADCEAV